MTDRRGWILLATLALVGAGGLLGWWAGPWLARGNYIVQVAEQVQREEAREVEPGQTLQSQAFRATGGVPKAMLFDEADAIRERFRLGGMALGIFAGLVIGLKLLAIHAERERDEYEADAGACLACCRCFESCPVEHERLGTIRPIDRAALLGGDATPVSSAPEGRRP
jgi:ferredoxin